MKKKNVLLLGIFLLVAVTSGIVAVTYSRYLTEANGNTSAQIAQWRIKINEKDVTTTKTFTIDNFEWKNDTAGEVEENHIAPGVTGTTSIVLDASETGVTLSYSIQLDTRNLATTIGQYEQIQITIGGELLDLTTGSLIDGYSGTIEVDAAEADKVIEVPVEIKWLNSDENNETDTIIGSTIETIEIPITVTAAQVTE